MMDSTAVAICAEDVHSAQTWESPRTHPRKTALRISYGSVAVMSSMVPAAALLSCAAAGTYLHWEKKVDTHCRGSLWFNISGGGGGAPGEIQSTNR